MAFTEYEWGREFGFAFFFYSFSVFLACNISRGPNPIFSVGQQGPLEISEVQPCAQNRVYLEVRSLSRLRLLRACKCPRNFGYLTCLYNLFKNQHLQKTTQYPYIRELSAAHIRWLGLFL